MVPQKGKFLFIELSQLTNQEQIIEYHFEVSKELSDLGKYHQRLTNGKRSRSNISCLLVDVYHMKWPCPPPTIRTWLDQASSSNYQCVGIQGTEEYVKSHQWDAVSKIQTVETLQDNPVPLTITQKLQGKF